MFTPNLGLRHAGVSDGGRANDCIFTSSLAATGAANTRWNVYSISVTDAEYVDVDANMRFPYTSPSTANAATTVTYVAMDSTGLVSTCDVTVRVEDDEPPTLQDCSGLDVVGQTDQAGLDEGILLLSLPNSWLYGES